MALIDRQKDLANYLVAGGWPLVSACASVGNATVENNCLPVTAGLKDHGSDGLYQWRLSRLDDLKAWSARKSLDWRTIKTQAAFHQYEMARDYVVLNAELRAGKKPIETLTANICNVYERPNAALAHLDKRIQHAKSVYAVMSGAPKASTGAAGAGGIVAGGSVIAGANQASGGHVGITVAIVCFAVVMLIWWWAQTAKKAAPAAPTLAAPRPVALAPVIAPAPADPLEAGLSALASAGAAWDEAKARIAKARAEMEAKGEALLAAAREADKRIAAIETEQPETIPAPEAPAEPAPQENAA